VGDRRAFAILLLLMMVVAVGVGVVAIGSLYNAQLDDRRDSLNEAVRLQIHLLRAHPQSLRSDLPSAATEDVALIMRMLGRRGTMLLGRRNGDTIIYIDTPWVADVHPPPPTPIDADRSVPMRRALAGEKGSMVATDASGAQVLAAFAPVPELGIGVVASADIDSFRAPFVERAVVVAGIALALLLIGTLVWFAVIRAIVRRGREREERYRELFESMRSAAAVFRATQADSDFVLTDFNRGGERIEGLSRQEILGRSFADAFPTVRQSRLFDVVRRVWRTGIPEHLPAALYTDDRTSSWREYYIYKLATSEIVILYEDVTERKQAEEALKESEARWRSIIEANVQAIIIVDQKQEIRFVNRAAELLFGHTSQDLIGAPFGFPLVQGDVAEIEIIRPGRGLAYGEMRAIPMRWSGQDNFLVFVQDVSAHKRAEGDLRKLFLAIEQSPASVMITDVEGRIEYVNPKFTETTGYTYPEVVGKTPSFLKSGYTSAREYQELWKTISSGDVWRGEFNTRRKNGELFWELASIAPVRDGRGRVTHYVGVKEDITDRKATEERLRRSQRMETIGQLTGGIAHDFNNLLGIILGNLQLLEERGDLDKECRDLVADAVWSAERGAQLTHRLLAFARRQRLNPRPTGLNEIVGEMAGLLRRTLGERIEIVEDLSANVWETMIDRGQLENALLNLVVNARDAMPDGGVLTIATGTAELPQDLETKGEDVAPGDYAVLSVADSGTGMPPETLERIFEPFFTTKKFGEGSGLGLSMVYGFVRQSGGYIVVDSQVGRGTTVKLFLPRASPPAPAMETPGGQPPERRRAGSAVVLVVDDDSHVRKTATSILRKLGYEVVEAGGGGEALRIVERLDRVDLVFADVVLTNGVDGYELARKIIRQRPGTRVLLTSGYPEKVEASTDAPAETFEMLPKPYSRRELAERVRKILDQPSP
jgi:PAS domain S-box-containing protein